LERARDYLVSRLREIGWETQVQETTMAYPVGEGGNAAPEQWASSPQPSPPPASAKLPPTSDFGGTSRRGKGEEREKSPPRMTGYTVAQGSSISTVQNVLARLPGKANQRSFVLLAHYDTVATGPG